MREDDQRIVSALCSRIAYRRLSARCVARPNGEHVLRFRCKVLPLVSRSRGIPDLTGKDSVSYSIKRVDCAHADRKSAADERIVIDGHQQDLPSVLLGSLCTSSARGVACGDGARNERYVYF